jgi:TRAP-type mannitol/chloroaromatic compound transport system substrate-binding protein
MKKENPLIFLGIICLLSALVVQFFMPPCAMSATAQAQAQKVYKWRMQAFMGPGNVVFDEALPKFIQNVKTMSKGQIDITLYPPGALVPSFELFTNIGKGVVDMGQDAAVYWMGFMPLGELVWGWPFTFKHAQEFDSFYWQLGAMDIVRRAAAERGVFPLVVAALNRYGSINSVVPIKGLKDLKGLKVRTFSTYGK